MSYVEYNHLLFEISERLDQLNQHEHLLLMCRGLVASRPEDIPNALSLFRELEDRNNLAIDQVELWKELLKAVGEWSLFQKVRKFEDKRKEYKELLEQISRALDESNQLQQLVAVCTEREALEENERNTQTARILFEKLERRGIFAFSRLDFLKWILSGIERQDLVKKVQGFEKRRIDEDEFERRKAQAGSIVAAARVVGGRVIGVLNMKTVCGVAAAGITLLTVHEILTRWPTYDQLVTSFQKCVLPAGSRLIEVGQGCVCFTIQVDNLMGLTALWNMYEDGGLKKRLFDFFVTDEMKTRAGGEENVELTVTIEKEEYEKAYFELVQEADDENSPTTITQLKNQIKSLEERMEAVETQIVPFEKDHGRKATEIIPAEEVQNASYERLGDKPWRIDEHKWNLTKMYVESLPLETKSLMSEASDSGMGTERAPSELDVDIGGKLDTETVTGDDWNSLPSAVRTGNFAIIEDMLSRGLDINTKNNDGNTALISAALTGKRDAVKYLLEKGADPFIEGHSGINPLHAASKDGNVAIIEMVMSRGLDVNSKGNTGITPLMVAAEFGKIEAVNYLLDKGADLFIRDQLGRNSLHFASLSDNVATIEAVMSRGLDVDLKDNRGSTPLMLAAAFGKIEAVNYLLNKGADPYFRDQLGRNSLHAASEGGNVLIITTIMSHGLDVDIKDNDGSTPLMLAAEFGKIEAVNYLLDKGADPFIGDQFGRNSLHAASEGGNVAIIETVMLHGPDVDSKDNRGSTPFMLAAAFGKIEAVNYLLDKGADPYIRDQLERNSLHAASEGGNVAVIETLMSRGLSVDPKNNRGITPLMMAAASSKIEAVNYLLDQGADPYIRDQFGRNSLHAASEGGNVAIIETLMSRGLDVDSKDGEGKTPLMLAAARGKIEAVNFFLQKGADIYIRDQSGRNSLHVASEGDNVALIETVMSRGLDVDSKLPTNDSTPLMLAAGLGNIEAVNCLLDKGADPFIRDQLGRNLLHAASKGGNVAIITKMLSLGLNVNSKDVMDRTPFNIAEQFGKIEAVNFLLSKGGH